ncbi:hypothetical protein OROMI_016743 [Orobanche minor]
MTHPVERFRDEVRNLPCSYKSRHDAAADLIHIYAYTKYFFGIRVLKRGFRKKLDSAPRLSVRDW